ncbi:unnamed protein product [Lampetra fluviatilis]
MQSSTPPTAPTMTKIPAAAVTSHQASFFHWLSDSGHQWRSESQPSLGDFTTSLSPMLTDSDGTYGMAMEVSFVRPNCSHDGHRTPLGVDLDFQLGQEMQAPPPGTSSTRGNTWVRWFISFSFHQASGYPQGALCFLLDYVQNNAHLVNQGQHPLHHKRIQCHFIQPRVSHLPEHH